MKKIFLLSLVILASIVSTSSAINQPVFKNNRGSAWYINQYPRAWYVNDKTYFVYAKYTTSDPMITYYDHLTKRWAFPVQVGSASDQDDHGAPSIWVSTDNYLHVIGGAHNNNGFDHFKSDATLSINGGFTRIDEIGATLVNGGTCNQLTLKTASYNQITVQPNGDLWLFFRGADNGDGTTCNSGGVGTGHSGMWGTKVSTDNGATWSGFTSVLDAVDDRNSWYARSSNGIAQGTLAVTSHWEDELSSPTQLRINAYYLYYNGTNWKNAAGSNQTIPLSKTTMDSCCRVYSSEGAKSYVASSEAEFDSSNIPYFLMLDDTDDKLYIKYYTSGAWQSTLVVQSSLVSTNNTPFALEITDDDIIHVYTTVTGEDFKEYRSTDHGASFSSYQTLWTAKTDWDVWHPQIVQNYVNELRVMFQLRGPDGITYMMGWGDRGLLYNQGVSFR